jgi:hypothetical protein
MDFRPGRNSVDEARTWISSLAEIPLTKQEYFNEHRVMLGETNILLIKVEDV